MKAHKKYHKVDSLYWMQVLGPFPVPKLSAIRRLYMLLIMSFLCYCWRDILYQMNAFSYNKWAGATCLCNT